MTIRFTYNPFDIIINIAKELYPDTECEIIFSDMDIIQHVAYTIFPFDGSVPQIVISPNGSYRQIVELLAHEIAHVVAGEQAGHGKEWDKIYKTIECEYYERHGEDNSDADRSNYI